MSDVLDDTNSVVAWDCWECALHGIEVRLIGLPNYLAHIESFSGWHDVRDPGRDGPAGFRLALPPNIDPPKGAEHG